LAQNCKLNSEIFNSFSYTFVFHVFVLLVIQLLVSESESESEFCLIEWNTTTDKTQLWFTIGCT